MLTCATMQVRENLILGFLLFSNAMLHNAILTPSSVTSHTGTTELQ